MTSSPISSNSSRLHFGYLRGLLFVFLALFWIDAFSCLISHQLSQSTCSIQLIFQYHMMNRRCPSLWIKLSSFFSTLPSVSHVWFIGTKFLLFSFSRSVYRKFTFLSALWC
jgi:hypothetical protein